MGVGVTTNGAGGRSVSTEELPSASGRTGVAEMPRAMPHGLVKDEPEQKVRELARNHLDRFISLESKVLKGDPDAIHDLRVASRRLQQVVDLLHPERPADIRKLRRRIKRARACLSEIRNCDVMLMRVGNSLARRRVTRRQAWEAARDYLAERRSSSIDKAVRKLGSLHLAAVYVKLKDRLRDAHHPAASDGDLAPAVKALKPAPGGLEEYLHGALGKVLGHYQAAVERSLRDRGAPMIHGVRIAAKRLRYLIEVLQEFGVEGSGEALDWLKRLQEHLGDWHDLEILEEMLIDMVARPPFLREHVDLAVSVERLILSNRGRKQRYVEKYFEMIRSPREGQRLLDWGKKLAGKPDSTERPHTPAHSSVPP